jgi:DnaJ-class molecular chaperone
MPGTRKQYGKPTEVGVTLGALEYVVVKKCFHCHGTGVRANHPGIPSPGAVDCPKCEGDGELVDAKIYAVD